MKPALALLAVLALAACTVPPATAPDTHGEAPRGASGGTAAALVLPPMRSFTGPARPEPPRRDNAQMARDFLDLGFRLESGRQLDAFSRFEGPVTLRVTGAAPPTLLPDLDRLLARLRREAGIDIRRVAGAGAAGITVAVVPRAELQRVVPHAACFVSPRVASWEEFRASPRGPAADWTTLRRRERMAVFVPADVAPQELRDCLHEEIAQALGPVNDLYRLPDSVFNDDNFHGALTGFDMLMLRLTYAPELASGMTRAQVAARLPALLARLNPGGGTAGGPGNGAGSGPGNGTAGIAPESLTPRPWLQAVETALDLRAGPARRLQAARRAQSFAREAGWSDNRRAFSLYLLGRTSMASDPRTALAAFSAALGRYRADPGTRLQAAHLSMQLAAAALNAQQAPAVLALTGEAIPVARRAENAALLAQLLLMRAEALRMDGREAEARAARTEGLGWARYGFGDDAEVRALAGEISMLARTGWQVTER